MPSSLSNSTLGRQTTSSMPPWLFRAATTASLLISIHAALEEATARLLYTSTMSPDSPSPSLHAIPSFQTINL